MTAASLCAGTTMLTIGRGADPASAAPPTRSLTQAAFHASLDRITTRWTGRRSQNRPLVAESEPVVHE
jgi:hypothetical protein